MPKWASLLLQQRIQLHSEGAQGKQSLPVFPSIPRNESSHLPHPPSAHHVLHLGQASLPAVVYEPQHDDDGTDGSDDHQYHEELSIIAACLVGV